VGVRNRRDTRDFALRKLKHAGLFDFREFVFDAPAHLLDADLVHEDFTRALWMLCAGRSHL